MDYRYELEGDRKYDDYDSNSLGEMGYQAQEFDDESGELINAEEDIGDEDFADDADEGYDDTDEEF